MTLSRRSRRRPSTSRARRSRTSWENLIFNSTLGVGGQAFSNMTPEPMQTTHGGVGLATIKRMIGTTTINAVGATTSSASQRMSMGISVLTLDALAASVVPDPETDFNQDFYYWTRRSFKHQSTSGPQWLTWDFDIRTMRRLRGGYALVLIHQASDANTLSMEFHTSIRALWTQTA